MKPAQNDLSILPIDSRKAPNAHLAAVFQTSHLAISVARVSDGCIVEVNQAFEHFFGYSREETIGRTSIQLGHWPDPGQREKLVSRLLAGEQVTSLREKFRKKSGETGYAQVSARIVDIGSGPHLVAILADVTEQALQEQQLHMREARYRAMLEGSIDGFWIVDRQGRILDVNKSYCRRSGYTREELLGMTVYDVDAAHSPGQIRSNFAELESKAARIIEVWHRAKDGSVWPIEVSTVYLPEDGGQFHSFLRDISERKRDEEALRKATEQFHAVVEQSPVSMALVASDGAIEYINRKAVDTFGYLPQDIPTMDRWWVLAYPDAAYRAQIVSQWMGMVADARARNREIEAREYRVTCRNGDIKLVLIYGVWIGDRVLAMFEDITERRQNELALEESERKYRLLFETANDAILIRDETGFVDCNLRATLMYGTTKEEFLYLPPSNFAEERQPDGRLSSEVDAEKMRLVLTGEPQRFEWRMQRADGGLLDVEVSLSRMTIGDSPYAQAIVRDISESKRLWAELEASRQMLEQRVSERTIELAHARNKLQALVFQLNTLQDRERRVVAMELHDNICQLLAGAGMKVRAAQDSSSMRAAAPVLRSVGMDLEAAQQSVRSLSAQLSPPVLHDLGLVAAIEWLGSELHKVYGITVALHAEQIPVDMSQGARSALYWATRELLINVVKHAQIGVAEVRIRAERGYLVISVRDAGVGFDLAEVDKRNPSSGFGLLSMAERLRLVNGEAGVVSRPGEGTVATLRMPLETVVKAADQKAT